MVAAVNGNSSGDYHATQLN